ncbi:MAG: alpha-L-fucosidase, partial [Planctomycetota bacterium]
MNTRGAFRVAGLAILVMAAAGAAVAKDAYVAEQLDELDAFNAKGPWKTNWDSLTQHEIPEWFQDAKLGIYAHWGVYSVPAYGSEWYPRNMYRKDSGVYKHHVAKYGDQSKFGYKDFVPDFTAEKFDAEAWAELYARAGARFAGPVAEHHDGFSMWASKVNRWSVGGMGPKRDITGELVRALRRRDIKIITSFHHAFNIQGYYTTAEGWDTADPKYADLYGQFEDQTLAHDRWLVKLKEVIDAYQPDQIWFDFGLQKIPDDYKQRMAAYYYNHEARWGRPVIITRKGTHLPDGVGALDIERGKMSGMGEELWQTDDSVATNSWCHVEGLKLKPAEELVHELIDIVSKNGVLLLNISPKADGTIPGGQREQLLAIGDWLRVNGEAIYATRPWKFHGEGPHLFDRGRGLGRIKQEQVAFVAE